MRIGSEAPKRRTHSFPRHNSHGQLAMSICDRLAEGENLHAICSDGGMPGRATVFRWIARHKEFQDALGSTHWNVDHCPVAMQLKKPAAVDCP
jgi:hypothetical protein